MKKNLVQIIKDNPNCTVIVDNDCWEISNYGSYPDDFDKWESDKQDEYYENEVILASSADDLMPLEGSVYQGLNCYGGAVLLALAEIVGINIRSV